MTSKLWNDKHGEADVIASCRKSLADLRLDYLDMYLVHWPFPNFHPPGCSVDSRSPDAGPTSTRISCDVAADGAAGGDGTGAAHRHVEHDDSQAEAAAAGCAHHGRRSMRWSCTRIFSSRSYSISCAATESSRWAIARMGSPGRPEARPHAGRHGGHGGSGDRGDRRTAGRASGARFA